MSFLDELQQKAENIATLKIITAVGDAQPDADNPGSYKPADDAKVLYSSINLLDGDMTSIIPEAFLEAPMSSIRQYHQTREDNGRQIIKDNIDCLIKLVSLVKNSSDDKPATGS